MTHENPQGVTEAEGGPEHTHDLPDADKIPVYADPADSDAAPLDSDLED